jgi:hypothetical protein
MSEEMKGVISSKGKLKKIKKWKQRQQTVDDKVNCLEKNRRKNKIVIFRILVSGCGGWVDEIYVDMDIATKFRKESNEWRNGEKNLNLER